LRGDAWTGAFRETDTYIQNTCQKHFSSQEQNMFSLEVKVDGSPQRGTATYEVLWLDWTTFKILPTAKRAGKRQLVSDGVQAFEILRGKTREKYLRENNYDPKEVFANA
jgi:hypothetical protein